MLVASKPRSLNTATAAASSESSECPGLPRRAAVDVEAVDHWWLCGPHGLVTDARALFAELGVPREKVHQELFYVDDVPPQPVRGDDARVEGPSCEVTVVLDGRRTTLALPRDVPILDSAQQIRGDLPFACKGGCAAPAGPG
jgi:ring-1,2-phenylacetyl-CoA epoxidase subunit PaaE